MPRGRSVPTSSRSGPGRSSSAAPSDVAAFDGSHYYAIANDEFTDTNTGHTYTLSGNTAVSEGNSYEIFSNLGQTAYFEVPGGPTYYVNIAVADYRNTEREIFSVFPISGGQFTMPLVYTITVAGSTVTVNAVDVPGGPTVVPTLTASAGALTGGYFQDPVTRSSYDCVVDGGVVTFVDSNNAVYPFPTSGATITFVGERRRRHRGEPRGRQRGDAGDLPDLEQSVRRRHDHLHGQCAGRLPERRPGRTGR